MKWENPLINHRRDILSASNLQHSILFFLQVNQKEEELCPYFYCLEERHGSAKHVAYAVYSLSDSYIYLDTETSSILPCNQIHTVQAHFILKWDFGVLKELVFYYLVSTGSKLKQQTNKQQTNNNKTKQNKTKPNNSFLP